MNQETTGMLRAKRAFPAAASLSILCFLWLQLNSVSGSPLPFLQTSNLTAYVITLFLFAAVFVALYFLSYALPADRLPAPKVLSRGQYRLLFWLGAGAVLLLLLGRKLITEAGYTDPIKHGVDITTVGIHWIPMGLGGPLFVLAGIAAVIAGLRLKEGKDLPRWVLQLCGIGIAAASFVIAFVANIFLVDAHHGIAYVESAYTVFYGMPYTDLTSGIYGHYGLFLAPVLWLSGGNNFALMAAIALLESLVAVLSMYCVCRLVKENYFRILGSLACCMTTLGMRLQNYWQVQPHRVLWPLIIVAFILHLLHKNRWRLRDILAGYGLCTLAVLWSTDSGVFCGVAFTAACIVHIWQEERWHSPKSLLRCAGLVGMIPMTVLAAIGILNGYNFLCGYREWIFKDFFFPLFESGYVSGDLEMDLPVGNHAWIYVLILFGGLLTAGLYLTTLFHSKDRLLQTQAAPTAPAMVAVALLGLCNFSYFANRAAYFNLDIILQLAGVAMSLLWGIFSPKFFERRGTWRDCAKAATAFLCFVVAAVLAFQTVLLAVPLFGRKIKWKHYDTGTFQQACHLLQQTVPEDTYAFGGGVSILYAQLGWDPQGHYRDIPDLSVGGPNVKDAITEDVLSRDSFAVYRSSVYMGGFLEDEVLEQILSRAPEFRLTAEAELNGNLLQYYTRTD